MQTTEQAGRVLLAPAFAVGYYADGHSPYKERKTGTGWLLTHIPLQRYVAEKTGIKNLAMATALTKHAFLEQTQDHIHIELSTPHRVMSSAVLNGGILQADHLVNVKVPKHGTFTEPPEVMLSAYCAKAGWSGVCVGMMTGASMQSFRMASASEQGIDLVVLATSGLSNPRRAGDHAEHRIMAAQAEEVGTVNIIVLTSAILTEAASIEALCMITEAKAAAFQDAAILSPVSNKIATGTGTDSVAIVSGHGPGMVCYCGKHVLFGELLGRLVTNTVAASIAWAQTQQTTETAPPRKAHMR